ncbi:MAG: DUF2927 domain-containing protein [Elainellaceae cyanobacterium]
MRQQSIHRKKWYKRHRFPRATSQQPSQSEEREAMRVKSILVAVAASTAVTLGAAILAFAQTENQKQADSKSESSTLVARRNSSEGRRALLAAVNRDSLINVRQEPTTRSSVLYEGMVGDRIQILESSRGRDDTYTWYLVEFDSPRGREPGWVREDLVFIPESSDSPGADPPANAPSTPDEPRQIEAPPDAAPPSAQQGAFTAEEIDYFLEVALGTEFGGGSQRIRKWEDDVRIRVNGSPTAEDRNTLNSVVSELNDLIDGTVDLQIVDSNPNVEMYFVPESEFRRYEPNYVPVNMGFAWVGWRNDVINRSRILITTVGVTQPERSHLIREELTQVMGLMRDSYRYRDSIFFQGWTRTTAYSAIDQSLIRMLYQAEIRPGMSRGQTTQAIARINSGQNAALRANDKSTNLFERLRQLNPFDSNQ